MSEVTKRTPERTLIIGCTAFSSLDSVAWTEEVVPNIPDYDRIVVSVPHITEDFLMAVKYDYLRDMRRGLIRFLDSGGKLIVLISPSITIERQGEYPEQVRNTDWCPISYGTPEEAGRSIVWSMEMYRSYLSKMSEWSFHITIPQNCLSNELTSFYGQTHNTKYKIPLVPYLKNRYERILAGQCNIEVRRERVSHSRYGDRRSEYPDEPDKLSGLMVFLPLIDNMSPEEALSTILYDEMGYSAESSPEPDWMKDIEMPFVADLISMIAEANVKVAEQLREIEKINRKISEIQCFRRLFYGTGTELEDIVKQSLERLGAKVSPAKYSREEYILEVDGKEFLMEVKGVAKSITLTHLRQLSDYMLRYQEDTGKECKGILFGNAWRNMPIELRGTEETPMFPDNVIKRAEQLNISLVPSTGFFNAFVKALEDDSFSKIILSQITMTSGVIELL